MRYGNLGLICTVWEEAQENATTQPHNVPASALHIDLTRSDDAREDSGDRDDSDEDVENKGEYTEDGEDGYTDEEDLCKCHVYTGAQTPESSSSS